MTIAYNSREEFEKWLRSPYSGDQNTSNIIRLWKCWQASELRMREEMRELVDVLQKIAKMPDLPNPEREAFEKWADKRAFGSFMQRERNGWYQDIRTRAAWGGWQACEAHMCEEIRKDIEPYLQAIRKHSSTRGTSGDLIDGLAMEALARLAKQDGGV